MLKQDGRRMGYWAKVIFIFGGGDFRMGRSVMVGGVIKSRVLAFGGVTWRDSICSRGFGRLVGF